MSRTINQQMGDSHEADIAEWTKGIQQKASGSQWHRQGDTKNGEHLVAFPVTTDGKSTMGNSISVTRAMWRKIVEQTFNQNPAVFLRFYRPGTTPWQVDLDLAVTSAGFFSEILEAARKWVAVEEAMSGDDAPTVDEVLAVVADGMKWQEQDEAFQEMVRIGQEIEWPITVSKPDFKRQVRPLAEDFEGIHPLPMVLPTVENRFRPEGGIDPGCDCCR